MSNTRAKDGYIVPLPQGSSAPEFVSMLPVHKVDLGGDVNKLLAVLVVERLSVPATTIPAPIKSESQDNNLEERPDQIIANLIPKQTSALPIEHRQIPSAPPSQPYYQQHMQQPPMPETAEEAYARRAQMSRMPPHVMPQQQLPPQLDSNAHAILGAFLRARPDIASNPQFTSNPQLMAQMLDEFVRGGGLNR